ncbi:MAG: glutamate-1-semialdehyde 2,1-aminomutase [Elusimicrobiota bacterium]
MEKHVKSSQLFKKAQTSLVGGVNSPVRAFRAVGGTPLFIKEASGASITDVDGNSYVDFVGSWGPMILGHNHPVIVKALKSQLGKGSSYGAPCEVEIELAELVKEAVPSIDLLRFTSSGTEATMSALRLARAFTKRVRIVKFEGGYHGHSDGLLVSAGSGALTFGVPSSAGVPDFLAQNTWVLPYNDVPALENLFQRQGINVAAVIVEPIAGNMGVVKATPEFIRALDVLTKRHHAILIFDEVMTGFRVGWGGAQKLYGIKPDLTCFGKIIGGGLPVGAFGGRKDVMELLAPLGPVYQAGTLSGNPLAMSAGLALLKEIKKTNIYPILEESGKKLEQGLMEAAKKNKVSIQVNRAGSMITPFFTDEKVDSYLSATQASTKKFAAFFHACLEQGIYLPPSQFEAWFLSIAHTPDIMDKALQGFEKAFKRISK